MKKLVILFLCAFTFNNYLSADFVPLVSFADKDGIPVNLFELTGTSIEDSSGFLIDAFIKYYERYEEKDCPLYFYQEIENLLDDPQRGIVIVAYKNNICVGWTFFELDYESCLLKFKTRVWPFLSYAPYLIFSIFRLFDCQTFRICLMCDKENLGAQKFYEMLGFNKSLLEPSGFNSSNHQVMEYKLNFDIYNMRVEINDVWEKLLRIEGLLNIRVLYICDRKTINDSLRDNINKIKKIMTKMELYYKPRINIFSELFDFNSRVFYQNLIHEINGIKIKLRVLEDRLDKSV